MLAPSFDSVFHIVIAATMLGSPSMSKHLSHKYDTFAECQTATTEIARVLVPKPGVHVTYSCAQGWGI